MFEIPIMVSVFLTESRIVYWVLCEKELLFYSERPWQPLRKKMWQLGSVNPGPWGIFEEVSLQVVLFPKAWREGIENWQWMRKEAQLQQTAYRFTEWDLKSHRQVLIGWMRAPSSKFTLMSEKIFLYCWSLLVVISYLSYNLYFSLVFSYLVLLAVLHPIRKLLHLNSMLNPFIQIAWIASNITVSLELEKNINFGVSLILAHQLLSKWGAFFFLIGSEINRIDFKIHTITLERHKNHFFFRFFFY